MERKPNFFQSWLYRTLQRWSKDLEAFGERCAKKHPAKRKSALNYEQQDAKQRSMRSDNKIRGTNVTGIYTQDWSKDETIDERIARLKRAASQSTKANRR